MQAMAGLSQCSGASGIRVSATSEARYYTELHLQSGIRLSPNARTTQWKV